MIHIYTGNGKGKTTCAIGLAVRARGQGLKVAIFQFLKPRSACSGELNILKKIKGIKLVKFCQAHPMFQKKNSDLSRLKACIEKDFQKVEDAILSGKYDLIVLDEIINCMDQDLICRNEILKLLKSVPKDTELILTGRGDISGVEKYADYITIMTEKKHPFRNKKQARKGIEY